MLWVSPLEKKKWENNSQVETWLLLTKRHTQLCACVFTYTAAFIASVRCCRKEVHVNIYIGFRKQLLRERSLLLFTQIQNKETLQRLPGIDMWACFFPRHRLEEVSVWDLFLTGLELLVVWHIFEQLLDTRVFKVIGTVCVRKGKFLKPLAQNSLPHD